MTYFLNPGVDIDGYDPAFKKYYNRVFGENKGVQIAELFAFLETKQAAQRVF